MTNIPLIILGSARRESDTGRFTAALFKGEEYRLLNLLDYKIAPYSYAHDYPADDDFVRICDQLLQHRLIVFATPVYWYSMSGVMKDFFDRLTDLITFRKEIGRRLRGRKTALLAVGSDDELPPGFTVPFKATSGYLGMEFVATAYTPPARLEDVVYMQQERSAFLQKLNEVLND